MLSNLDIWWFCFFTYFFGFLFAHFCLLLLHVLFEFCFAFQIDFDEFSKFKIASLGQETEIFEIILKVTLLLIGVVFHMLKISPFFGLRVDVNCYNWGIFCLKTNNWIENLITFCFILLQPIWAAIPIASDFIINRFTYVEVADISNNHQKRLDVFLHQIKNGLSMFDDVHLSNLTFLDLVAKTLRVLWTSSIEICAWLLPIDLLVHHILNQLIFDQSQLHIDALGQLLEILILQLLVQKQCLVGAAFCIHTIRGLPNSFDHEG